MGFWSQVVKGNSRIVTSYEVLGHKTIDISDIKKFVDPMKNGIMIYGGDYVAIFPEERGAKALCTFYFNEYGPNKESRYSDVNDNFVYSLEVSPHGETALLTSYSSGDLFMAVKLHLQ